MIWSQLVWNFSRFNIIHPCPSLFIYSFLCFYEETIARIPYFSYVSMLHLYESFGWFRAVELRKVHAAEGKKQIHEQWFFVEICNRSLKFYRRDVLFSYSTHGLCQIGMNCIICWSWKVWVGTPNGPIGFWAITSLLRTIGFWWSCI